MTKRLASQVEEAQELAALEALPYEDDPDLAWEPVPGDDLPYDGDVPADFAPQPFHDDG